MLLVFLVRCAPFVVADVWVDLAQFFGWGEEVYLSIYCFAFSRVSLLLLVLVLMASAASLIRSLVLVCALLIERYTPLALHCTGRQAASKHRIRISRAIVFVLLAGLWGGLAAGGRKAK